MAQTTGQLPAVNPTVNVWQHAQTTNQLVKEKNRQDTFIPIYAADTGSGTAYVMTPTPGVKFYRVGQIFVFKAANANTGTTPTLNVNGWGAGTITRQGGAALAVGDIAINDFVEVICTSTTPTFQITSQAATPVILTGATTFLAANVALNNVSNFFNGPNTGSIGANGQTWLITAVANIQDGASFVGEAAIYNGTTYIANSAVIPITTGSAALGLLTIMAVVALTAATTFTLRCKSNSASSVLETTGGFTTGAANVATSITAVRLA